MRAAANSITRSTVMPSHNTTALRRHLKRVVIKTCKGAMRLFDVDEANLYANA
jgi:hypothetical protein